MSIGKTSKEWREENEALKQQLAEREQERRGVIADSKMHPLWLEKSKEELLDALRFQGATTAALLEETAGYRKQLTEREKILKFLSAGVPTLIEQTTKLMMLRDAILAVCCDPEGKVCIHG